MATCETRGALGAPERVEFVDKYDGWRLGARLLCLVACRTVLAGPLS